MDNLKEAIQKESTEPRDHTPEIVLSLLAEIQSLREAAFEQEKAIARCRDINQHLAEACHGLIQELNKPRKPIVLTSPN